MEIEIEILKYYLFIGSIIFYQNYKEHGIVSKSIIEGLFWFYGIIHYLGIKK